MYDSLVKRLKIFNMDQKVDCMYVELVMQFMNSLQWSYRISRTFT